MDVQPELQIAESPKTVGVTTGDLSRPNKPRKYNKSGKYARYSKEYCAVASRKRRLAAGLYAQATKEDWKLQGGRWKRHMDKQFVSPYKKSSKDLAITDFFSKIDDAAQLFVERIESDIIDLTGEPSSPVGPPPKLECVKTLPVLDI